MAARLIRTDDFAATMRERVIRSDRREILISRLSGSAQETDLSVAPNSLGLGRIRHFRRDATPGWPDNPLPIDPACRALGLPLADLMEAQVFQNAACAWRCWFCYVPFEMLSGDEARGEWVTAETLVDLYTAQNDPPKLIDLSGGSPDLTPEWVPWMMEALRAKGLDEATYLWSDDNLSTDYVFTKLGAPLLNRMTSYRNYGRVCCLKGFDEASFSYNTGAEPAGWDRQFDLLGRYLALGLDLFGYVTLTGPDASTAARAVPQLIERLARLDEAFPLRTVPLRIQPFTPLKEREMRKRASSAETAMSVQDAAIEAWAGEMERRYGTARPDTSVALSTRRKL